MVNKDRSTTTCPATEDCPWQEHISQLHDEISELKNLVSTDTLTGLFNYRHFIRSLDQELERSQRTGQPTALIMLDLDHFKAVNDNYGHDTGNKVLINTAAMMRASIRRLDIPCRYGGEEFAIILPATGLLTGSQVAERIRASIADNEIMLDNNQPLHVTASLGVAIFQQPFQEQSEELIRRADEQLYKAKQSGRNRVSVARTKPQTELPSVSQQEKDALSDLFGDSNGSDTTTDS